MLQDVTHKICTTNSSKVCKVEYNVHALVGKGYLLLPLAFFNLLHQSLPAIQEYQWDLGFYADETKIVKNISFLRNGLIHNLSILV